MTAIRPSRVDDQCGLTMVELLVVAVLLAMMGTILFGTVSGLLRSQKTIDEKQSLDRAVRSAFEQITKDLQARVAEPLTKQSDEKQGGFQSSYLIGENATAGSSDSDSMRFVAMGRGNNTRNPIYFGRVEITYRTAEDDRQTDLGGQRFWLVRDELPAGKKTDEEIKRYRLSLPIADGITGFNCRYYADGKWSEEWAAGQARLPDAVEIEIGYGGGKEPASYKTVFVLATEIRPKKDQDK